MEGRNQGTEQSEAAGHLLAELDIISESFRHGQINSESARARVAIIRARARSACGCAVKKTFGQLDMQWEAIMADAEQLRAAYLLSQQQEPAFC